MAQLVKFNRAQVLKNAGVQLISGAKRICGDDDKKEEVIVSGKDLTKECPEDWQNNSETAEFLGGNPDNSGTCDVTELVSSLNYEVLYFVTMKDEDVTSNVTLALELPNGFTKKKHIDLTVKLGEWEAVSVGTFLNTFSSGNIKFSFSGEKGDTWKGLLIQEVMVAHVMK